LLIINVDDPVSTIDELPKVRFPVIVRFVLNVKVFVYPVQFTDRAVRAVVPIVQFGLFVSKNTSSDPVGTELPPDPPEVVDQFEVLPQRLSTPPFMKYLFAITI
jgi:hypothetical protein